MVVFGTFETPMFILSAGARPGAAQPHPNSGGPVVISDGLRNPTVEKLERVRKWSINTYKVRTGVSERDVNRSAEFPGPCLCSFLQIKRE